MKIEDIKKQAEYEVGMGLQDIKLDANHIIDSMNRIIQRISRDGININLNSLGELQSQGTGFDIRIATFCEKRRTLERLESLDTEGE